MDYANCIVMNEFEYNADSHLCNFDLYTGN
jgi:hypothetical protein